MKSNIILTLTVVLGLLAASSTAAPINNGALAGVVVPGKPGSIGTNGVVVPGKPGSSHPAIAGVPLRPPPPPKSEKPKRAFEAEAGVVVPGKPGSIGTNGVV
ncbi:hypothetical protein BGZ96_007048, partial [Linnemannia gamsii]